MRDMARENGEQFALLPYKEEIGTLAQSLKGVLGADVIVVDKYLNRIVNTFHYRYNSADIRINSVVGNIVTTQKLQMIYDRKYFTDCVNCPDRRQADALARLLFMRSIQDNYQIVKVDCSEDERILETVLLDREEGSPGVLFLSQESVVYLYGIDHLPMYLQNKLAKSLRGSWEDEAPAHVRVIATSGRNLYAQVKKDRFSMELYNMISRNKISIPQVSGVPEDIRFYFEKYLERYCGIYGQPPIRVGGEAWSFLERRRWEGGVQEIRETAERIVIRAEGEELGLEELAAFFPEESLRPQNRGIVEDSIESQLRRLLGAGMTKEKIAEEMGVSRATLYRWIEKFKLNESALRERESAG